MGFIGHVPTGWRGHHRRVLFRDSVELNCMGSGVVIGSKPCLGLVNGQNGRVYNLKKIIWVRMEGRGVLTTKGEGRFCRPIRACARNGPWKDFTQDLGITFWDYVEIGHSVHRFDYAQSLF